MRTIYLDIDGVVADFDTVAKEIVGYSTTGGLRYPESDWQKIIEYPRFYRDLPLCIGAENFVSEIRTIAFEHGLDLKFLTAIPKENDMPYVFMDKVHWVDNNFPDIPIFFGLYSTDKYKHCKPNDILIDDRVGNCFDWNLAGGIAILHKDIDSSLAKLKELF